jgi:hypothetical protein
VVQLSPHPEQFVFVPRVVHTLLQSTWVPGQAGTHAPPVHDSVPPAGAAGHCTQFVPQWAMSESGSHRLSAVQKCWPPGQPLHEPLMQRTPVGQAFPHAPQLLGSDSSLTQSVAAPAGQPVSPVLQVKVHALPLQAADPVPAVAGPGQAAVHEVPQ